MNSSCCSLQIAEIYSQIRCFSCFWWLWWSAVKSWCPELPAGFFNQSARTLMTLWPPPLSYQSDQFWHSNFFFRRRLKHRLRSFMSSVHLEGSQTMKCSGFRDIVIITTPNNTNIHRTRCSCWNKREGGKFCLLCVNKHHLWCEAWYWTLLTNWTLAKR